jgi:hypothetical protein
MENQSAGIAINVLGHLILMHSSYLLMRMTSELILTKKTSQPPSRCA